MILLKSILVSFLLLHLHYYVNGKQQGKMVGGTEARAREFPYSVSIRTTDLDGLGHFCGGAILSPNMIITAGVCTDPRGPNISQIVAGTLNRADPYPGQQVRKVATIVPHPDYINPPYDDLSLIFLDTPFEFNENISAIALPSANQTTYPHPVIASGWGAEQYGLPLSDVLMRATLDTYSDAECESFIGELVPPALLCAGTDEGGISLCIGDAGAPLTTTSGQIYLAGIGSHFACMDDCCGFPGPMDHNPEIAYYLDWIIRQSDLHNGGL